MILGGLTWESQRQLAEVVTRPDSPEVLLVVEVVGNVADQRSTETALKSYMVHMSCLNTSTDKTYVRVQVGSSLPNDRRYRPTVTCEERQSR